MKQKARDVLEREWISTASSLTAPQSNRHRTVFDHILIIHICSVLCIQDYCWEDHGYSLVNRLYPDVGQLIDEKFHIAYNLTYNTMAMHKDVDTSMLRRAIWNYIHCMFGIRYDDYDYGEINQLLDRSFKVYIKTVVCTPEKVTKRMYDSFWRQFKHSEKVHVNLLLIEARMQAELLYALRAITRYMT